MSFLEQLDFDQVLKVMSLIKDSDELTSDKLDSIITEVTEENNDAH